MWKSRSMPQPRLLLSRSNLMYHYNWLTRWKLLIAFEKRDRLGSVETVCPSNHNVPMLIVQNMLKITWQARLNVKLTWWSFAAIFLPGFKISKVWACSPERSGLACSSRTFDATPGRMGFMYESFYFFYFDSLVLTPSTRRQTALSKGWFRLGKVFSQRCHLADRLEFNSDFWSAVFSTAVKIRSDEHGRSEQNDTIGVLLKHVLTNLWNSYYCRFGRHGCHVLLKLARVTPGSDRGVCASCALKIIPRRNHFAWCRVGGGSMKTPPPKLVLTDVERSALMQLLSLSVVIHFAWDRYVLFSSPAEEASTVVSWKVTEFTGRGFITVTSSSPSRSRTGSCSRVSFGFGSTLPSRLVDNSKTSLVKSPSSGTSSGSDCQVLAWVSACTWILEEARTRSDQWGGTVPVHK